LQHQDAKIARYRAFWSRESVTRPLAGFTCSGWFPFEEFAPLRARSGLDYLTPDMVDPQSFVSDHLRLIREGELMDDDLIRGACPAQGAIPWLPAALGAKLRILPGNVLGEEQNLPWEEALCVRLDAANPWFRKYLAFAETLVQASGGSFPVGHSPELGPSDLHALLRGHTQSILDLADEPARSQQLLWRLAEICRDFTAELWKRLPLFHGGYFDPQYSLWSPGPIARLQEDATAAYSPALYRRFVQPVDRFLAAQFANSFIHLHSTSMFLLDLFLEIDEIRCFEINQDALGPPVSRMIPYFRKVQEAGKPLLIRGSFTCAELRLLVDSLEPRGLMLNIMARDMTEVEALRPIVNL
jgi:hypothetical protein